MEKKQEFIIGMTLGGMLILSFYLLLFFPVLWLYMNIPVESRNLFKYIAAIIFTVMLINSARGAYQSLKIIKNHESIIQKVEQAAEQNTSIQSYVHEGLKYRLLIELALF